MGSQTARGFPYPVGTDRVMDGDNAIRALAEKVDTDTGRPTAAGAVSVATAAVNVPVTTLVTFPAGRFTAAPAVSATPVTTAPQVFTVSIGGSVTTTSVPITANRNTAGGGVSVNWVAVQP